VILRRKQHSPSPGRSSADLSPPGRGERRPSSRDSTSPAQGEAKENLVLVGEFGRPHGVRGEIRLKSFTGEPAAIAGYSPLTAADGRHFEITQARPAGGGARDMFVVRVRGVDRREAAEALNRVGLYVPRERLAVDLEEDEFLQADLIGLAAQAEDGRKLGTVVAFHEFGAGDIIEIAPDGGGPTVMLPFTKEAVPVIAVENGHVVVDEAIFAAASDSGGGAESQLEA
jgi:16S rRNA processing protein RimM